VSARPGQSPAPAGAGLYVLAFLLSPLMLVTWLVCAWVRRCTGRRWPLALGGLAVGALVVWAEGGPEPAVALHFGAYLALARQFGQPIIHLPLPGAILLPQIPLSIPAGMLAAAASGPGGRAPAGLDPAVARQAQRAERRRHRRAYRAATRPAVRARPALARDIAGDLPAPWHRGPYVVLPPRYARLPRIAVGRPGVGKSVYLGRETFLAALAGERTAAIDCKGDGRLTEDLVEAYRAGWKLRHGPHAEPTVHIWPEEPLCGWLGEPMDVVNRLLAAWDFTPESSWYREIAAQALRLAIMAPGKPVASSAELMRRMDAATLAKLWAEDRDAQRQIKALGKHLDDVITRVGKLMVQLGANLDGPPEQAIGRADLTILSLPVMAAAHDAESILRVVMADLAHYVVARKQRGVAELLIVDEFSAVPGGREQAIHISERGRSLGVATILAVQSERGLGTDEEADRLVGAGGAIVLFNTAEPERLLKLAGTVQRLDVAAQVEGGEFTGRGTVTQRMTARVDANRVRSLGVGEAYILADGRAGLVAVIEAPRVGEDPRPRWRRMLHAFRSRARVPVAGGRPALEPPPAPKEIKP
jgi:hypothetical protein